MKATENTMQVFRDAVTAAAVHQLCNQNEHAVIGYLDTGFPEEIALAAGYQPILLTADTFGESHAADEYLDLAAPSRVRDLYGAFVSGKYEGLDLLCVTGGDRWIANTFGFLEAYRAISPTPSFDAMYIDRTRGTYREHWEYNREQLAKFRDRLAARSGVAITNAALSTAIALTNETRRLFAKLSEYRRACCEQISGSDAQTIYRAAVKMPRAQFNAELAKFLTALPATHCTGAHTAARLFVSGSSVDHPVLHSLIETTGARVVGEDTEFGERVLGTIVNEDIDPLDALADQKTLGFAEPWTFGQDRRIALRVAAAVAAQADGEVFLHVVNDAAIGWDFPDQRTALNAANIPVCALAEQPSNFENAAEVALVVTDFVESLVRAA